MTGPMTACPSCKKNLRAEGRYCIHCGSILRPVYCSQCGTVNPDDLTNCLECGNPIPKLTDIRWGPVVNVLRPTEAMTGEAASEVSPLAEPPEPTEEGEPRLFSRLKGRFRRRGARDH